MVFYNYRVYVCRYATNGRPLIWADANNGSMLLDPLVARWG